MIVFIHIPKTAGGTLTSMFARAWQRGAVHKAGNFMRGPDKTVSKVTKRPGAWENWQRRGGRLSVGHVPYRLFEPRLPDDCRYITFLRDPVDRVLSHYYRHIHDPDSDLDGDLWIADREKVTASSLEEAMAELRLPQVNNLATRFLCDDPEAEELGDEALAEAKANLRRFAFVGIQERFDESVALLQLTLGLGAVPYGEHRHVSVDRPAVDEVSDAKRSLIEEHNRLDAELYAYGRDLFEEALTTAGDGFAFHLDELRAASAAAYAAAYEEDEAGAKAAGQWLDSELPLGATKPRVEIIAAAREAGIHRSHIKRAMRELPGVEKWGGETGEVKLTRVGEPGSESAIRFEERRAASEKAALEEVRGWLERELPRGATKSRDQLVAAAQEAGITLRLLGRVIAELPEVETRGADTGGVTITRRKTASTDSGSVPGGG